MNDTTAIFREPIRQRFGVDIERAEAKYSSSHRVYVFPEDFVVSLDKSAGSAENRMGELRFLKDLADAGVTVCAAIPSLAGRLLEPFTAGGEEWTAVKYVKAKGDAIKGDDVNERHAERVGETLGRIHALSRDAERAGVVYARPTWREAGASLLDDVRCPAYAPYLEEKAREKLTDVLARVGALEIEPGVNSGMIHGDFNHYNYYVSGEEIWVFDFGDCGYGCYLYDVATLLFYWLTRPDANVGRSAREAGDALLTAFRRGYERQMTLPEAQWTKLELFMSYRQAVMILDAVHALAFGGKIAGGEGIARALPSLLSTFLADDLYEGIDRKTAQSRATRELVIQALRGEIDLDAPENVRIKMLLQSDDMKPFIAALLK